MPLPMLWILSVPPPMSDNTYPVILDGEAKHPSLYNSYNGGLLVRLRLVLRLLGCD